MADHDVIDVGVVSEDQRIIVEDGGVLTSFLRGVTAFMETAQGLERRADGLEARAKAFQPPTTAEDDAAIQRFVQEARGVSKEITGHWLVAGVFHRMHKRLVALRDRGAGKAEKAGEQAQRLHNAYAEAERRRVAAENLRLQQEAEAEASRQREADAAKAEAEAMAREETLEELSDRERRFVELFAFGLNTGQTAARSAGYAQPAQAASRLLSWPKIGKAIKAAQEAQALRKQAEGRRAAPLEVRQVEPVKAAIEKVGSDRTTWRGEVLDEAAFVAAVVEGKLGIPLRCLTVNQAVLTECARNMRPAFLRWPGVRVVKTTTTV